MLASTAMLHRDVVQRKVSKSVALVAGALAVAAWSGPWVLRADLFEDDAAQHTFWLYRYADPGLFAGDPTARFFALDSTAPWGYRTLYAALAPYVDVLAAGEWLAALLFAACLALGWAIGRRVAPESLRDTGGLLGVGAVAWLVFQRADALTPLALQRSFALPLTLLLLWALLARRWFWLGACWLLAAVLYPVIVVVLGLAGGIALALETRERRRLPPLWYWNALAGAGAIAIVLVNAGVPADVGPTVGGREALAMAEFGADGRLRLFGDSPSGTWFRNHLVGLGWAPITLLVLAGAALAAYVPRTRVPIPRVAWLLLGAGLATWLAARLVLFELYLPNRHARWAIAAFGVAACVAGGTALLGALRQRLVSVTAGRVEAAAAVAVLAAVAMVAVPSALAVWRKPVDADLERAYAFLRTLPADTLVGAHPDVADFVPLRARRAVLASTETSLPFMQGYYRSLRPRLEASLQAAYATGWAEFDAVLDPWGVDVFVTSPRVWRQVGYYAPFDALVRAARERGLREGFVLAHPDASRVLFRSGDVYVVRVGPAGSAALVASRDAADPPPATTREEAP